MGFLDDKLNKAKDTIGAKIQELNPFTKKTNNTPNNQLVIRDWYKTSISPAKNDKLGGISFSTLYINDSFFRWAELNDEDLRYSYPYEFLIVDGNDRIISSITFPINPQSVVFNVPTAIAVSTTMKGIIEEHNSSPLRQISISGTTGIMPALAPTDTPKQTPNLLQTVLEYAFSNTIQQLKNIERQITQINNAFTQGTSPKYTNLMTVSPNKYKDYNPNSGYVFMHNLARFFDAYLALKKQPEAKDYKLVFQVHKDKMYYNVTLNNFNFRKQAGSLEYFYNITLTAWERRPVPVQLATKKPTALSTIDNVNKIQNAVNQLRNARKILAQSYGVLQGIRSDIETSFINPLRELILYGKDIVNLSFTMLEFMSTTDWENSSSLMKGLQSAWKEKIAQELADNSRYFKLLQAITKAALIFVFGTDGGTTESAFNDYASGASSVSGGTPNDNLNNGQTNPITNIVNNPALYPEIFDDDEGASIESLDLNENVQELINQEIERVRQLTPDDLRQRRKQIEEFIISVSESLGGGSESFSRVSGRPKPKKTYKQLSTQDIAILDQLNSILISIDNLIAALENSSNVRTDDYYTFYRDFAISNGLNFGLNTSKFYVPFPYGSSLEALALQYLGDANRWIEIAALNGLQAPYVDEEGFYLPLLAPASGDSITIPTTYIVNDDMVGQKTYGANQLYIGQVVEILSDTLPPVKRKIRSIDIVSSVETIVTFEPVKNQTLAGYKVSENARLHTFLPNTVNSLKLIAIPSSNPVTIDGRIKIGAGIDDLNGLFKIAKTDFLLDKNGDLVFSSDGDIKLAQGLTNIIQAAMMILRTKAGSLLQNPSFGVGVEAGTPSSEIDTNAIMNELQKAFSEDSRFNGIVIGEVSKRGVALNIKVLVEVASTGNYLPLEAEIPL